MTFVAVLRWRYLFSGYFSNLTSLSYGVAVGNNVSFCSYESVGCCRVNCNNLFYLKHCVGINSLSFLLTTAGYECYAEKYSKRINNLFHLSINLK